MSDAILLATFIGAFGFVLILAAIGLDWTDSRTSEYERFLKEWNKKP